MNTWTHRALTPVIQRHLVTSLDLALTQGDDAGVWDFMQAYSANSLAQDALAQQLSRSRFPHRSGTVFTQIHLMPVVAVPPVALIGVDDWPQVNCAVKEALQRWYPRSSGLVLFPGVTPYPWVASWTPQVFLAHLRRMQPLYRGTSAQMAFSARTVALPAESPQLGFIVIGCSSRTPWPEPVSDTQKTTRLEGVVRNILQLGSATQAIPLQDACWVLAPLAPHEAIPVGVVCWLERMHATVGVAGYAVNPSARDQDVIEITLRLVHDSVHQTAFELRRHQVGPQGVATVLARLQSLAPMHDAGGLRH